MTKTADRVVGSDDASHGDSETLTDYIDHTNCTDYIHEERP